MILKKAILLFCIIGFAFAEQSVYSDSDFVDAESLAKQNGREIFMLKQQISQLKEKIEGLKTIIQGQQNEISALKQQSNNNYAEIINQLSQRVAKLESNSAQAYSNNTISKPKVEQKDKEPANIEQPKKPEPKEEKISNKDLYKQSVLNFTKKRLTKAKSGFESLLAKNYKKASSSFYLGEIAFNRKKYKDAISYYQKSATLNENASYMDKLLLHTAISLKKIGKTKQAKGFFNAIVTSYPDSSSAKEASKYLK